MNRALLDVLADADLKVTAHLWVPRTDYLTAPCWWQWRAPCGCPDTSFGRSPHRWDCPQTPTYASVCRDLNDIPKRGRTP